MNTFLHKEVDSWKKDKTMQMAKDLGVGWIKQQFPWAEIQFSPSSDPKIGYWDNKNGQSAWTKYDNIVSLAQQYGLRVVARIDSAPLWSHPGNPDPKAPPDAAHMADFGDFVGTFVNRYRGSIAAIQVWNEPNLKGEWATGNPVNAAEYTDLLKVAYTAAKNVNPDIIVLAAPLATTFESLGYAGNLNELDYMQDMYDAGAKPYFDAMAANAYGTTFAPEDPPSPDRLNFRRVELLHDIMVKNGDANKAVWFNEYGWNSSPDDITNVPWGRVTPNNRATIPCAASNTPARTGPGREYSLYGICARSEIFPAPTVNSISASLIPLQDERCLRPYRGCGHRPRQRCRARSMGSSHSTCHF